MRSITLAAATVTVIAVMTRFAVSQGLPAESAPIDTLNPQSGVDTVITYSARQVEFTFNPRLTLLTGEAKIAYRSMTLEAEQIKILWDDQLLIAEGKLDTISLAGDDTTKTDSVVWKGLPRLDDGTQVIEGVHLTYNLTSHRGRVIEGDTEYQQGFYHGGVIKRMEPSVYNIRFGYYTTCNLDPPHYGFWSRDMKLLVKDKVIARPVVLYFSRTPVLIIPFAVFPARGGRHSGIIVPTYGESANQGRYFSRLGYYWAPNDYLDLKGQMDYYERYGLLLRADANYAKRYVFGGGLSGSLNNQRREGQPRGWDVSWNHNHDLSRSATLNVNAYYQSFSSYLREVSRNTEERLRQEVRSDATLAKRWIGTPYSVSLNVSHREALQTGEQNQSLPRVSINRSQTPLFPAPEGTKADDLKWWNKLYFNYSGFGHNQRTVTVKTSTRYETSGDSTRLVETREKIPQFKSGVRHDLRFNMSFKPFGVLSLTPGFSLTDAWFDEWQRFSSGVAGGVESRKEPGFHRRTTFSGSAGLSSKIYGMFYPRALGVEALRHTMTPSVSFTYQPDFSKAAWRYFDSIDGVLYDRFQGTIFGGTPRNESRAMRFGVENLFEYKRMKGDEVVKGQLFTFGVSSGYDFARDSLQWADLRSTLRAQPGGSARGSLAGLGSISGLNLEFRATNSFYDGGRPVAGFPKLVNFDLAASFKIQGGEAGSPRGASAIDSADAALEPADRFDEPTWNPSPVPWNAGVSVRYGERRSSAGVVAKDFWTSVSLELQATKNWKLSTGARMDFQRNVFVASNISLYRDLHCWEGRLVWNPTGVGKGFYLIISVKAPQLKDIKVEKRQGYGGGTVGI